MKKGTSQDLKPTPSKATEPQPQERPVNGKIPRVRTASKEQFEKAHRKTSTQHAGLFRRLTK